MDASSSNIPQSVTQKIDLLAQRWHSSPEVIMNEALSLWVRREEKTYQGVLEGIADVRAGRVVSDEAVQAWIDSLDTDNPLPLPQSGK